MGTRVAHAYDLGELLTWTTPRAAPDRYTLIQDAAARAAMRAEGAAIYHDALPSSPTTDLQVRIGPRQPPPASSGPPDRPTVRTL